MKIIDAIKNFLLMRMDTPTLYGSFHLISILLVIVSVIVLYFLAKKNNKRTVNSFIIFFTVITLLFEVIKQVAFTLDNNGGYQWYALPFQFCSTPMYVALASVLTKNKSLKQKLYSFLAFYGLFGGLLVMVYPGDVFISLTMINYQTMIHHGGMVVVALLLTLSGAIKLNKKNFADASIVFSTLVLIAFLLNITLYMFGITDVNLFFISPFGVNNMPVIGFVHSNTPYIIFLLTYVFVFMFGAFLVSLIAKISFTRLVLKK